MELVWFMLQEVCVHVLEKSVSAHFRPVFVVPCENDPAPFIFMYCLVNVNQVKMSPKFYTTCYSQLIINTECAQNLYQNSYNISELRQVSVYCIFTWKKKTILYIFMLGQLCCYVIYILMKRSLRSHLWKQILYNRILVIDYICNKSHHWACII